MAKFSVPGIKFTEIDNTVRAGNSPSNGRGAIVMKSNKGPVNQRILTSSYQDFTDIFGEPENLDDFGHFAAENYLANGTQLFAVRATMGDESYAQIQYPYTDAEADYKYKANDIAEFKFTNNEGDSNLQLLQPLSSVTVVSALTAEPVKTVGYTNYVDWQAGEENNQFYVNQYAQCVTISDLITDAATQVAVFKSVTPTGVTTLTPGDYAGINAGQGTYVKFVSNIGKDGAVTKWFDDLIFTNESWTAGEALPSAMFNIGATTYTFTSGSQTHDGRKVSFTIPGTDTLNSENVNVSIWLTNDFINNIINGSSATYRDIFKDSNMLKPFFDGDATSWAVTSDAMKLQFVDWDDCRRKTYYVETSATTATIAQVKAISYREYGMANNTDALVIDGSNTQSLTAYGYWCSAVSALTQSDQKEMVKELADSYGLEISDISNGQYSVLAYNEAFAGVDVDNAAVDAVENKVLKIVYASSWDPKQTTCVNDKLFWIYSKQGTGTTTTLASYCAAKPETVTIPWQEGIVKREEDIVDPAHKGKNNVGVNKLIAYPTSELLNSTNETYKDGYTMSMESDEEPGNGDVEQYVSNKQNQLIIAAIGPGKFGNDIGVSVITTACADVPALNHQNAFNWKYKYDDEDLVDADDPNTDFIWKKVYRINVYSKLKTQTADAAWGTGMDALLKEPIEYFYVSNDPQAKDGEGNSLFAPNVINGNSRYIYVSRNSVNDAMTGNGSYAQPEQTYAIYGLTGGTNSKKNNMSEKTAALKLYVDRQKADFDILFNVEAIDTFNGRQRYAAHQRKIAEIAAARTMDIGVVQLTSKESKTCKRMLSEGKAFAFNNGSYVAPYGNYDKYYNNTLASWIYLPKSIAGACAMGYCDMYSYPWMAPAGTSRGTITYTTNQLTRLSDAEIGQLYDNNINTSRMCGGYGEVLWGHKTALKKDSALNRINVRRCMNYIEKQLENMLTPYLFAQNTENTRSAARNVIDAFLGRVKASEGIIEYDLSVEEDPDDEHVMLVNIGVIPAEAIEFIDVKITLKRKNVTMTESVRS